MPVTRCPNCETSFRVTDDQLAVAKGAVRCGACLKVFKANRYMIQDSSTAPPIVEVSDLMDETQTESVPDIDLPMPDVESEDVPATATDTLGPEPEFDPGQGILLDGIEDDEFEDGEFDGQLNIENDPSQIVGEAVPDRPAVSWRWRVGVLLLVLILPAQLAWIKRYDYATHEILGPYYDVACQYLPCELPEYSDLSRLKATDLVVRSHPQVDNALRIDAIIVNQADVRQVFPDVEIRFANMNNRLLAARIFEPREYLKGELAGLKYIPARTEVRISLEIVDPGPEATNYTLNLY